MSAKTEPLTHPDPAGRFDGAFLEIDSEVCTDLREKCGEYADVWRETIQMHEDYPVIVEVLDAEEAVSLSPEEHRALLRYLQLEQRMENMERKSLYLRGQKDNYAYLRMIGAI